MNADEMFAELGFEKQELNDKLIGCSESYLYAAKISMKELQAINKKCEELGWLDEDNRTIK